MQENTFEYEVSYGNNEKSILLSIDSRVYQKEALLKTVYCIKDKATGLISMSNETSFKVKLILCDPSVNIKELIQEFHSELIENQLRCLLDDKFGDIRNNLYRKLLGYDEASTI